MTSYDKNLSPILKKGGVAIIPTDTIYGIVGLAQNIVTVNRIYSLKKRNPEKPCIILIGDISELEKFNITLSEGQKDALQTYWPGPVSIIFECKDPSLSYIHRGTETLAFRLPSLGMLKNLLIETGPLIAPSANPEGLPPAKNIMEANK